MVSSVTRFPLCNFIDSCSTLVSGDKATILENDKAYMMELDLKIAKYVKCCSNKFAMIRKNNAHQKLQKQHKVSLSFSHLV